MFSHMFFFPDLMGPQWEYLLKATHYSGRPQVQSKYACRLPANKSSNQKDTELAA